MNGSANVQIDADPRTVWQLVADVTRMGDWSPECNRCEWLDGAAGPAAGARFRGHNRLGPFRWSTVCTISSSEPGREFSFVARHRSGATTLWRYSLAPADGGTRVTETYEALKTPRWIATIERAMRRERILDRGMQATLERLRLAAERQHEPRPG